MGQVTWDYFIPKQWNHNYLAMQMQDIFRTLTKLNHKQDIYLLIEILQYPGDQLNKRWWPMQVSMGGCVVKPVASHIALPYIWGSLYPV